MGVKFTPSPYLAALRKKYEGMKASSDALKNKAVAENRALSDPETASVRQIDTEAKALFDQIQALHDAEEQDAKMLAMRASLNLGGDPDGQGDDPDAGQGEPSTRGRGGAQTRQRDPGHYRSIKDGGKQSFFADLYKSANGDQTAAQRLAEHTRSIDTAGEGAGVIPPKWLLEEFAATARQGRALANAVRNVPLGDDPRPMSLPKQTGAAAAGGAPITVDQAEVTNSTPNTSFTDAWDSDVDSVTPRATTGGQIVTRQLLDMANPAIDGLIFADLLGAYDDAIEAKVCTAVSAVGTALPALGGDDVTDPDHYNRVALDAAMQVRQNRKRPPNVYGMSNIRYGKVLGLVDTTGRPLVPSAVGQAVNVSGVGSVAVDGIWHGAGVIATAGFADDDRFWSIRLADVLLFESNMYRFRYEQPLGPDLIKLGIWAYAATLVRYGTASIKRVEIDES
jgi:hypothetical protein